MPIATLLLTLTLPTTANIESRAKDWRIGAIVYQVFVDRFAPPKDLEEKRKYILPPRTLKKWSETPKPGKLLKNYGLYSHELEFWGGDLASLRSKLGYIHELGADVLYLQPIQQAFTNHKYDAQDFNAVDPEYGTRQDVQELAKSLHEQKMRLMLDGVFNHMGKTSPIFQDAFKDPASKYRNWFNFDARYEGGYRAYSGVPNMPALNLENPDVRDYLWEKPDSVVQKYLREGVDGWRLDVAFELGPTLLADLTHSAHEARLGSAVVGEVSGYPSGWFPSLDGVFDFTAINLCIEMLSGRLTGGRAGEALGHLVEDAGLENLMRSWLLTDNHDTPRLADVVPEFEERSLVHTLQMTLPGCPVLYYGTELGMTGSGDPQNRAPMRWDLATDKNRDLMLVKRLIRIRKSHPALRYGDFTKLDTDKLLGFARTTDKVMDTVVVLVNPTAETVSESLLTRVGRLMSWGPLQDVLTGGIERSITGFLRVKMRPKSAMILVPVADSRGGYSPYHRIP